MIRIIKSIMSQVSKHPISKSVADRIFEIFLITFTHLKNTDEADQFISDLLTPIEKIMLSKRLAISFLLERNYDYRTIQQILKVSTGTITSVNMARKLGSEGYKKVISKIMRKETLVKILEDSVIKLLSAPASLERGNGTWTYLKNQAKKNKFKNKKAF